MRCPLLTKRSRQWGLKPIRWNRFVNRCKQMQQQQLFLGSLAAIVLLVAAMSITNTMIMSIYERTREIGVMKVLGCKVANIRQVFLMEAGSIGFCGGLAGVGVSLAISKLLNYLATNRKLKRRKRKLSFRPDGRHRFHGNGFRAFYHSRMADDYGDCFCDHHRFWFRDFIRQTGRSKFPRWKQSNTESSLKTLLSC